MIDICGISKLSKEERLTTAVILGTIFLMAELIGGIISNSLAVIADAAHLFTDVFGFVIALLAVKYARAEATSQFTFGFARVEVFSALFSIVLLWGVTIWLVVEAIQRGIDWSYGRAEEINGPLMFGVACFGIFVNICLGLVFHEDHSGGITSHCHHDHDHVDHEEEASVNFLHSKDSDGHPYVGLDHRNHEDHDHKHEHDHGHDGHSCSHHSSKKTSPRASPSKSASKDDHDHAHHDHGHNGHHECEHDHDHGHDHHNNDHDHDHGHDCDDDHEDHDHCHSHRDIEKGQLIPLQVSKSNSSDRPSSGKNKGKQPSHSCSHDHDHHHHSHSTVKSTCSHDHHEQHHGHDHSHFHGHGEDVNMQAAFLHVLTDLLQSIGVAIGGAIIWAQPTWQIADVICTLLFSVLVLMSSKPVATRIFLILFEASPKKVNTSQLRAKLLALDSVLDVHDLHVWNLSSTSILLTCHILASADSDVVCQRAHEVCDAAGIDHATIQVQRARGKGVLVEGTGCYSSSCRHDAPKFKCHRYNDGLSKDVQV